MLLGSSVQAADSALQPFTVVAIGDTQSYVHKGHGDLFEEMVQWIADSIESMNIVFVTQEGDIVQNSGGNIDSPQWVRAHQVMSLLDGRVPYSVSIGDHDYDRKETHRAGIGHFVHYFGKKRYTGQPWYGDCHPMQTSHYQFFRGGGRIYLHLNLECDVPGKNKQHDHVAWAQRVIDRYAGLPTIVTTHSYVTDARKLGKYVGRTKKPELSGQGRRCGEEIWKDLITKNAQIFMVLNGNEHLGPMGDNGEYYQISKNDNNQDVFEVLTNYQGYRRGGDGFLRLITFDEVAGTITFQAYSPTRRKFRNKRSGTPRASQFALQLNFDWRFGNGAYLPAAAELSRRFGKMDRGH